MLWDDSIEVLLSRLRIKQSGASWIQHCTIICSYILDLSQSDKQTKQNVALASGIGRALE